MSAPGDRGEPSDVLGVAIVIAHGLVGRPDTALEAERQARRS